MQNVLSSKVFYLKWQWHQLRDYLEVKAAHMLPRWLVYRAVIRCGVEATTGAYAQQVVPELTLVNALQRWHGRGLAQSDGAS